jgi:hypothetical protein
MKSKETILNKIFRDDPYGILGEKTMPIESKELLQREISFVLNQFTYSTLKDFIQSEDSLSHIELNPDSEIWLQIEEFIADKIIEDNQIKVME